MELLGEYKDSGFKEPPFLARRADGQVLQLPRLLYLVAANSDGRRSYGQIAEVVTEQFGRGVSADNVQTLADNKLRPLGVLAAPDGSSLKLARPGVMGVGIYLVWPAFYTDVTDAYRLGKGGRLRTDLGGVYFNVLFILGTLGIYLLTRFEVLIAVVLLLQFEMLHQFLPFLRLDGY